MYYDILIYLNFSALKKQPQILVPCVQIKVI